MAEALDFVADGGITFTMLWDPSGRSWTDLEVDEQPAAILYAGDGTLLGRWDGALDDDVETEIRRLIRA